MIVHKSPRYDVTAYWGSRFQDPTALVGPFVRTLDELASIDPVFAPWYFAGRREATPFAGLSEERVAELIADGVGRDDSGNPMAAIGYSFGALTATNRVPNLIHLRIHAGNRAAANYFINSAIMTTEPLQEENEKLITASIMRAVLLVLVRQWQPTWCGVRSSDLFALYDKQPRPKFDLAWMTYLSPHFAQMVPPPRSAIVEQIPDGGLLMIATNERFSAGNPRHLEIARHIKSAIAPVNALPWPPDAEG